MQNSWFLWHIMALFAFSPSQNDQNVGILEQAVGGLLKKKFFRKAYIDFSGQVSQRL